MGIGMGNTCKPMTVSFQCMTKSTTNKKKKRTNGEGERERDAQTGYLLEMRASNKIFLFYSVYHKTQEKNTCVKAFTG